MTLKICKLQLNLLQHQDECLLAEQFEVTVPRALNPFGGKIKLPEREHHSAFPVDSRCSFARAVASSRLTQIKHRKTAVGGVLFICYTSAPQNFVPRPTQDMHIQALDSSAEPRFANQIWPFLSFVQIRIFVCLGLNMGWGQYWSTN